MNKIRIKTKKPGKKLTKIKPKIKIKERNDEVHIQNNDKKEKKVKVTIRKKPKSEKSKAIIRPLIIKEKIIKQPKLFLRLKKGEKINEEKQNNYEINNETSMPQKIILSEEKKDYLSNFEKIPIPNIKNIDIPILKENEEEAKFINMKYPLYTENKKIYAYANIVWDYQNNEIKYNVIEPNITEVDKRNIERIKKLIEEKLDINFNSVRKKEAENHVKKIFFEVTEYLEIRQNLDIYWYYVNRDFMGLGEMEPLMHDKRIEDISCDGVNIPVYIYHRDPYLGSVKTNIKFDDKKKLDLFVIKLAERCGKTISIAEPLVDGILPDGSRIQATLSSDIARHGSNFTVRKFSEKPLTPTDLLESNSIDVKTLSYLWAAVEFGSSILISGGTATGKTTLLNVLSLFIKPQMKIVSIEDTGEIRLPHEHWVPEVARTSIETEKEVDMFKLLKESLRQRPDYIIVGEVRGREAFVLFQQIAMGHPGLSTIHAENFTQLMNRLTTKPISLPANLIESLDIVVFLRSFHKNRKHIRKLNSITEIVGFDKKENYAITNEVIRYETKENEFLSVSNSVLLNKYASMFGLDKTEMEENLKEKGTILSWMYKKKIRDYKTVGKVINMYYADKERLLTKIESEL